MDSAQMLAHAAKSTKRRSAELCGDFRIIPIVCKVTLIFIHDVRVISLVITMHARAVLQLEEQVNPFVRRMGAADPMLARHCLLVTSQK